MNKQQRTNCRKARFHRVFNRELKKLQKERKEKNYPFAQLAHDMMRRWLAA